VICERSSRDGVVSRQGRDLLELVEERGWLILNGEKRGDEEGEWTFEKAEGKSVIDFGFTNWVAWGKIQ